MSLPEIASHHLEVTRTSRYYTIGTPGPHVSDLWIVLHGYAQLAAEFVQPFRAHDRSERLIVAPEGLSRFYRNNRERVVGASWMTSEDRKMDIRDYVRYLNAVYAAVLGQGVQAAAPLSVLGFSQGTATATRWLAEKTVTADRLILWGGLPAFELCSASFREHVPVRRIQLVTGTKDPYLSPARHREIAPTLSKGGADIPQYVFEGGHEINAEMLSRLMDGDLSERTSA